MPITSKVEGDLVELATNRNYHFIIHGANCKGVMGSGIAPQIADKFFGVRDADLDFVIPVGDKKRLGNYSSHQDIMGRVIVINAYTQFGTASRRGECVVDYKALEDVFTKLNQDIRGWEILSKTKAKIGIPLIGCGLAGGDWNIVENIINKVTTDIDIELVEYKG